MHEEEKRLKDLQFLEDQASPGPFTCREDMHKLVESCGDEKEKTEQMYIEVRDAKGFGDNKTMLRLKKDGKKLRAEEYQDGLETYFKGTKGVKKNISKDDLKNAL